MRKHDIVIRMRGARFSECDPERVAELIRSTARMIERPGETVTFGGCSGNALRLRVRRTSGAQPQPQEGIE